jgi:hypothetical protein
VTAAQLRARAIKVLTRETEFARPSAEAVAEAGVWARLAVSAAIEEAGQAARRVDTQ